MADDTFYIGYLESRQDDLGSNRTVEVEFNRKTTEINVDPTTSLLDALLSHGVLADYCCKAGVCISCMATIEEGCISQKELGPLTDEHIREKKTLLCQAQPASKKLKLRQP
ncbi:MAG: 2Fe-2S iron-sulfur cluster-binding protein [Bacteriovoracia bacterium]